MMDQQTTKTTLLLVIKNPIIRSGIHLLFSKSPNIVVVGETQNKWDARAIIDRLTPKVLLYEFFEGDDLEEFKVWANDTCKKVKILILTTADHPSIYSMFIEVGTVGYLNFASIDSMDVITEAIHRAAQGYMILEQDQMETIRKWREEVETKASRLTSREKEILILLAKGLDNKTISEQLGISCKTVAYHATSIFSKLSVQTRQEALIWAMKYLPNNPE